MKSKNIALASTVYLPFGKRGDAQRNAILCDIRIRKTKGQAPTFEDEKPKKGAPEPKVGVANHESYCFCMYLETLDRFDKLIADAKAIEQWGLYRELRILRAHARDAMLEMMPDRNDDVVAQAHDMYERYKKVKR